MGKSNGNRVYRSGNELINQINQTMVPTGGLACWHLGQESMVVKGNGHIIYFDPYLTNYVEESGLAGPKGSWNRDFISPLHPEEVSNATLVLITHHHLDHLDPTSIGPIAKHSDKAIFICPSPHVLLVQNTGVPLERIIPAKIDEVIELDGIRIHPIPAKHEEFLLDEYGHHQFLGYVIELNGCTFYHAGDTVSFPELPDILGQFSIDVACLPINGRDCKRLRKGIAGNMNYREAADLVVEIRADLFIPFHYDLFHFNTENPAYVVDYLFSNYPGQKFKMMVPGERMLYLKER